MRKAVRAEKRVDVIEKEMEKRDTTSFERERERDKEKESLDQNGE